MTTDPHPLIAGDDAVGTPLAIATAADSESFAISVRGSVDASNVGQLRAAFRGAHRSGAPLVRVDLRECGSIDVAGIGALLGLERRVCRSLGRDLLLTPSSGVSLALAIIGLQDYFPDPS